MVPDSKDTKKLVTEAEKCRSLARSFDGRPEQPFLLKIAAVYDDLARPRVQQIRMPK